MKIIMVVGRLAAGKSTFTEQVLVRIGLLVQGTTTQISFSDSLGFVLETFGLPRIRANYSTVARAMREGFGREVFGQAVRTRMASLKETDLLILQGPRYLADLAVLEGYTSVVVAIEADRQVRYQRARNRGKDWYQTYDQFWAADNNDTEGDVDELIRRAQFSLANNGDNLGVFCQDIQAFLPILKSNLGL